MFRRKDCQDTYMGQHFSVMTKRTKEDIHNVTNNNGQIF
jgi:hypothetical protein